MTQEEQPRVVPLTFYDDDGRHVIGEAKIKGDEVVYYFNDELGQDIHAMILATEHMSFSVVPNYTPADAAQQVIQNICARALTQDEIKSTLKEALSELGTDALIARRKRLGEERLINDILHIHPEGEVESERAEQEERRGSAPDSASTERPDRGSGYGGSGRS